MSVEPIFIISLPRAGSTLLQRLLMGHPYVASCGEPWLALPLVSMLKPDGTIATYGHQSAARSIRSFVHRLPEGELQYYKNVGVFLKELYSAQSPDGSIYFVDKTPRYYKILEELRIIFPDAPMLFLIRNPIGVFSSMLNFVKGDLRYMPMWRNDWFEGHSSMARALSDLPDSEIIRFEELLATPHELIRNIMMRLGLEYSPTQVERVSGQRLERGDPTGTELYTKVDTRPIDSWKQSINTPTKKRLAMSWLSALPEDVWGALGYLKDESIAELHAHRPEARWSMRESISLMIGRIYFCLRLHLVRKVFRKSETGHLPFYN